MHPKRACFAPTASFSIVAVFVHITSLRIEETGKQLRIKNEKYDFNVLE